MHIIHSNVTKIDGSFHEINQNYIYLLTKGSNFIITGPLWAIFMNFTVIFLKKILMVAVFWQERFSKMWIIHTPILIQGVFFIVCGLWSSILPSFLISDLVHRPLIFFGRQGAIKWDIVHNCITPQSRVISQSEKDVFL